MFGRLFMLLVILLVLALAVMFDWFGARDLFETGLETTQQTVENLSETGDRLQQSFESKQ
jgi:hypothetical protein